MFIIGCFYNLTYQLFIVDFWIKNTFLVAIGGYIICGIIFYFINKKFFHMELKFIIMLMLISSMIIIMSLLISLGIIKINFENFESFLLHFWVFIFSARYDPMRIIGLGLQSIAGLVLFFPLSFWLSQFLFRK